MPTAGWIMLYFYGSATTQNCTLSLHDALPISSIPSGRAIWQAPAPPAWWWAAMTGWNPSRATRSEEHTSELQSRLHLVCRLLLEKKKKRRPVILAHEYDAPPKMPKSLPSISSQ